MFLRDSANQKALTWLGSGLVAVAGGAWAMVKFFARRPNSEDATTQQSGCTTVEADRGGIAAGRDVSMQTSHGLSVLEVLLLVSLVVGAVLLGAGVLGKRITAIQGGVAIGGSVTDSIIIPSGKGTTR
jgi:hypothetical protein